MVMELYKKLDHAFNKDLNGAKMDVVAEEINHMGYAIRRIRKMSMLTLLKANGVVHTDGAPDMVIELELDFDPDMETLRHCEILVRVK